MPHLPHPPAAPAPALRLLALVAVLGLPAVAAAQAAPSAGSLLEESRRPPAPTLPPATPPRVVDAPARPVLELPEGASVEVRAFRISGHRSFDDATLQPLLAPFTGRRLDLRGLNEAAAALTRHYQRNGHLLSYAYLPAQRVDGGVVELAVLEGRIEAVQVVTAQEVRLADRVVQAHTDALVSQGEAPEPVLQARVERQLLLLNDIPGVTARAAFTPGASTGGADLVVSVAEDEPLVTRFEYNNHGSSSTGPHRGGITLQFRDLFGAGDSTVARGFVSNRGGLVTGSLATQVPVGGDGWRLGASLSRLKYQLGGSFSALGAVGRADTVGFDASYPLRRSVDQNVWLRAGVDFKRLTDELLTLAETTQKRNQVGELGLSMDGRDQLWGRLGLSSLSATASMGQLSVPGRPQAEWRKAVVQAAREQVLAGNTRLYLRLLAQTTGGRLDSSEKLGLAGAGGVRAYAPGELSVDIGRLVTLELRQAIDLLGGSVVASLFHDRASGSIDRGSALPGNDATLSATGLGLQWNGSVAGAGLALTASLAWRGSRVPTSDESDPRPRLYLQLQITP
jgi:hemolysin activation/secretion protein